MLLSISRGKALGHNAFVSNVASQSSQTTFIWVGGSAILTLIS